MTVHGPQETGAPDAARLRTHHRFAVVGVLVALLVVGGSAAGVATTNRPAPAEPALTATLRHHLLAEATALVGGRTDSTGRAWTAEAVHTTRARFAAVSDGDDWGTGPFWVVQVRGSFVCRPCKGPPGSAAARGSAYYFPSDTHAVPGYGFGDPIDLTRLGRVHRLR